MKEKTLPDAIVRFKAGDTALLRQAFEIRRIVFIAGQSCPEEEEFDGLDETSVHYLAFAGGTAAGTARYRETGEGIKLERFAVPEQYRGRGVGAALLRRTLRDALPLNRKIYIHAQARLAGFYEREGFEKEGGKFSEVGIDHCKMVFRRTTVAAQSILQPTLLLDKAKAVRNIRFMAGKARQSGVTFRPHFKTHQSAAVGEWYRGEGVECITVSSLDMALYFADAGWTDITVAFPANVREIKKINTLAGRITLHLVTESAETMQYLARHLSHPVNVWIKVDVGYHRAGMDPADRAGITAVALEAGNANNLRLAGILAHAGHSYKLINKDAVIALYDETVRTLQSVRSFLEQAGCGGLKISVGDTPCCSLVESFRGVDEIRAGNFVFYDVMQMAIGSCTADRIAVVMACPVVAVHPQRSEILIYGGGVHFSKDFVERADGSRCYGYVTEMEGGTWGAVDEQCYVSSLSQEHGTVRATDVRLDRVRVGDLLYVLPVHSCLAADLSKKYLTTAGEWIEADIRKILYGNFPVAGA